MSFLLEKNVWVKKVVEFWNGSWLLAFEGGERALWFQGVGIHWKGVSFNVGNGNYVLLGSSSLTSNF